MKNYFTSPRRLPAFRLFLLSICCFSISSFLSISTAQAQLEGTYTIGGADGDYASFTEAAQALEAHGVSGPVTFKVRPGLYREQLHLSQTYKHLTFEGESSDSTQVVLENISGHAVLLDGGHDYTFRRMTLSGSGSAVHIRQGEYGARQLLLESNILKGGEGNAVIEAYEEGRGFSHHEHTYRNNLIIGKGTGISKTKDTHVDPRSGYTSTDSNLQISGNIIQAKGIGIHLYAQEQVKINDNRITVESREGSGFAQGISLSYVFRLHELNRNEIRVNGKWAEGLTVSGASIPEEMLKNRILLPDGGTGIYLGDNIAAAMQNPVLVANNMVAVKGVGRGSSTGLHISNPWAKSTFYHNSILVYGESPASKALILRQGPAPDTYKVELLNNIFANKAGGHAVHVNVEFTEEHGLAPLSNSDYNVLYSSGEMLAKVKEQDLADLSQWQSLTGFDAHSLAVDPQFESEEDLIPTNPTLDNAGIGLEAVTTDFFDQLRNDPPDIGAVEFEAEEPEKPLAGSYTIGGEDADFANLTEATQALEMLGISGAVTFKIRAGTYDEAFSLETFSGSACENPVVFEGESQLNTDVVIGQTIRIEGADGVTLRNLTIDQVNITEGSNCITLENNRINYVLHAISGPGAMASNHHIYRNNHIGGGIRKTKTGEFDPASPDFDEGLEISDNTIGRFSGNAVELSAQKGFFINNNTITIDNERDGDNAIYLLNSWYGKEIRDNTITIRSFYGRGAGIRTENGFPERVSENKINISRADHVENPYGEDEIALGGGTGIVVSTGKTESGEVLIANNDINVDGYDRRTALGSLIALHIQETHSEDDIIKVYHNNLHVGGYKDGAYTPLRAANTFVAEAVADNSLYVLNNIFSKFTDGGGGYAYNIMHPASVAVSDYNLFDNFRQHGSNDDLAWGNETASSLEEWQALSGMDENSIAGGPYARKGIKVDEVDKDIEGKLRNDPPSIGAYELDEDDDRNPLEGSYTIGGEDGNYADFYEAIAALQEHGITGPVTFKVRPGTYEGSISIPSFWGNSCENGVTFEGESDSNADVILQPSTAYTVLLNEADGITFRNMSIIGSRKVIEIRPGTDCISLENNVLRVVPTSPHLSTVIVDDQSTTTVFSNQHTYRNNVFVDGDIGLQKTKDINLVQDVTILDEGLIIEGNEFRNQEEISIHIAGQKGFRINRNTITQQSGGTGIQLGISLLGEEIIGNTINISGGGNRTYTHFGSDDGVGIFAQYGAAKRISENKLVLTEGGTAMYINPGRTIAGEMLIANNRVEIEANEGQTSDIIDMVGLWIPETNWNVKVYHNSIRHTGYAINGNNTTFIADGTANTLHILNNSFVNNAGGYVISLPQASAIAALDYNNLYQEERDVSWEFGQWGDAAVETFEEWQQISGHDTHSISVSPNGNHLHEAFFQAGTPVEEVSTDLFGQPRHDPPSIGAVELESANFRLSGTYTIGGEDGDFVSFNEALSALERLGTSDNVVFKVRPGTYREQLIINASYDHVTFEGENSDSTAVVLEYPDGYAVWIINSSRYTFRNMTISGRGAVYIEATENRSASHLYFENNILEGTGAFSAVITNTHASEEFRSTSVNKLRFLNNYISGESWGIFKSGTIVYISRDGVHYLSDRGLEVSGNIFETGRGGIHVSATHDVIVNNNRMMIDNRPAPGAAEGMQLSNSYIQEVNNNHLTIRGPEAKGVWISGGGFGSLPEEMMNNHILLPDGGTGLHFGYPSSDSESALVANNMITVKGESGSMGILMDGSGREVNLYFNSVLIYGEDTESKILSLSGYVKNVHLHNNIFANTAGGIVVEGETPGSFSDFIASSDYNNLYTNGELLAQWQEGAVAALSEWQSQTGFDQNSLSVDPQFESAENLIPANPALDNEGLPLNAVTTDFFGQLRNDPPDIGAVEFEAGPEVLMPLVDCIWPNSDGTYTASFGYHNPNDEAVTLAIGSQNSLSLLENAGQPTVFGPGRHEGVFYVVFDGSPLSWTLGGETVTVDRNKASCESPVHPVEPLISCVTKLRGNVFIATAGYHNPNAAPVAIAPGSHNSFNTMDNAGQPSVYMPGELREAFHVMFDGHELQWQLGSLSATANRHNPKCSTAVLPVLPMLDCVEQHSKKDYTAYFGYYNPNSQPVSVAPGLINRIIGRYKGAEQAMIFEPGRHERAFSLRFDGKKLKWQVGTLVAVASSHPSLACGAMNTRMANAEQAFSEETRDELLVYPNFFKQQINIRFRSGEQGQSVFRIYSLTGVLVAEEATVAGGPEPVSLDLQYLRQGAYILEIRTSEYRKSFRIFKQ